MSRAGRVEARRGEPHGQGTAVQPADQITMKAIYARRQDAGTGKARRYTWTVKTKA
jgi:hypothetical protein